MTSRGLVEAALEAIAATPAPFLLVDTEGARAAADASDLRRRNGRPLSPLDGAPVSIKDVFDVAGQITTGGSQLLAKAPAAVRDAPVTARLRAHGIVLVGRTHMSEFAFTGLGLNPHHPVVVNPYDAARAPGGSSSGAAVSVALGQACAAIGTDTGGSVRIPAAFCGLAGFKPTKSRVTCEGVLPLSTTLDSVGPIARDMADCAALDAIIADAGPPPSPPPGQPPVRLGLPDRLVLDDMDAPTAAAFDDALRRLKAAGVQITTLAFPELDEIAHLNRGGSLANAEAFAWHRRRGGLDHRALYDPRVLERIELGAAMSAADYLDLLDGRDALMIRAASRTAGVDAVIMPTVPISAPRLDDLEPPEAFHRTNALVLRNPSVANVLGRCAATLPMSAPGAPAAGLTLMGAVAGDGALLALAQALEEAVAGESRRSSAS